MNAQEAWEDFVKTAKSNNQTSIEDKIDVLLAQQNEISTDTERIADLVPEMLADEEEQKQIDDIEDEESLEEGTDDPYTMLDEFDEGGLLDEGGEEEGTDEGVPEEGEAEFDEDTDVVMDDEEVSDEEPEEGEDFDEDTDVVIDEEGDDSFDFEDDGDEETEDTEEESEDSEDEGETDEEASDEDYDEDESFEDEEPEDEDEDKEKAKKSVRKSMPITKTIKPVNAGQRYRVVAKTSRMPENMTYGHASNHDAIAKMLTDFEFDTNYGTNTNPKEETAKDWEMYELMKKLPWMTL